MSKVIIEKNGPVKTVWMNRPEKRNALDSELLKEIFGDAGQHVRAAVGANTLPRDAAVEIEVIFTAS